MISQKRESLPSGQLPRHVVQLSLSSARVSLANRLIDRGEYRAVAILSYAIRKASLRGLTFCFAFRWVFEVVHGREHKVRPLASILRCR